MKYFATCVFLIISVANTIASDQANPLNLLALPLETLDHIAQYLIFKDRESNAEFIKRSNENKRVGMGSEKYSAITKYSFALSTDKSMLAAIQPYGKGARHIYRSKLVVLNTSNGYEIETSPFTVRPKSISSVCFNKQGTKIVVHTGEKVCPIIVFLAQKTDRKRLSKKTFDEYCRQYCICKAIPSNQ